MPPLRLHPALRRPARALAWLAAALASIPAPAEWSMRPEVAVETRVFARQPAFPGQLERYQPGLVLGGDLRWSGAERRAEFRLEPYLRLDGQDERRSYFDLREAYFSRDHGDWRWTLGASTVFWGVAESRNVVDVINQTDALEDFDEGEKLGQPMLQIIRRHGAGAWEFYYLPWFRERASPGVDGRLRAPVVTDDDRARHDRGGDDWAGDFALRHTRNLGGFDLGVHVFHGTNRAPLLEFDAARARLVPRYQRLQQVGLDLQYTRDAWLWKIEAVGARIARDEFAAAVAGFEYTFFDLAGSGHDLGLIVEYLHDGRDPRRSPATLFDDDVFVGLRHTFNDAQDTELLVGAILDPATEALSASAEFQRRLGARTLLELEARAFRSGRDPFLRAFTRDQHLLVRLTRFF